jgi:hypothetical protein
VQREWDFEFAQLGLICDALDRVECPGFMFHLELPATYPQDAPFVRVEQPLLFANTTQDLSKVYVFPPPFWKCFRSLGTAFSAVILLPNLEDGELDSHQRSNAGSIYDSSWPRNDKPKVFCSFTSFFLMIKSLYWATPSTTQYDVNMIPSLCYNLQFAVRNVRKAFNIYENHCIPRLTVQFAHFRAFQLSQQRLRSVLPQRPHPAAFPCHFTGCILRPRQQRRLLTRGRMCATLVLRLLHYRGSCAVKLPFKLATTILSQQNHARALVLASGPVSRVATFKLAHHWGNSCTAFHPSLPIMATLAPVQPSKEFPALTICLLKEDASAATCVVKSGDASTDKACFAFHPTLPLLVSVDYGGQLRLVLLRPRNVSPTIYTTSEKCQVPNCVAFHPRLPLLAALGTGGMLKLWNCLPSEETAVGVQLSALTELSEITCFAFHPLLPLLAVTTTACTVQVWRVESACVLLASSVKQRPVIIQLFTLSHITRAYHCWQQAARTAQLDCGT